jgi:hypothetical protein
MRVRATCRRQADPETRVLREQVSVGCPGRTRYARQAGLGDLRTIAYAISCFHATQQAPTDPETDSLGRAGKTRATIDQQQSRPRCCI